VAAPTTVTYGGLNLNDGTTYTLLDGFDPGERVKSWAEHRGYDGTVAQYNVSEANLIEMRVPLLVKGSSNATLTAAIAALNALIDAGAQSFVYNDGGGAVTYSCTYSPRVNFARDTLAQNKFAAYVDMILYRTP